MLLFDERICTDLDEASGREWLETNGIGGFACGTVSGVLTRRYHSLLTAATEPPLGRITTLAKFEETLTVDGERLELSTNRFPGTVSPEGYKYLYSFRLDPFPVWTFRVGGIELERSVFMIYGRNAVACRWRVVNYPDHKLSLELRPLLSFVDYHAMQHENTGFVTAFEASENVITIQPDPKLPALAFSHNATSINRSGHWYRNFELAIENERGFDSLEDLFQPFAMTFDLAEPAIVIAACGEAVNEIFTTLETNEIRRRTAIVDAAGSSDPVISQLALAADQFIVKRGDGHTIIAGYPWFSDWGRDTMIALPGLTLSTGRPDIARDILLEFSKHISQGMLPNRFPDHGAEAEYNTVDATLWYFEAIRAYIENTGDRAFVKTQLFDQLTDIIDWHLRGTRYGIRVDTDGLLCAGEAGVQLTWMDAKSGDLVITPRQGKAVEIQALWYNALRVMADLSLHFGKKQEHRRYDAMAELCEQSFNAAFWNVGEKCLFDVVDKEKRDGSVRPNQIFAASLTFSMLTDERARAVVDKVGAELLTPVGLRSLSPLSPDYCPVYVGSPFNRDSAYHQGTVWAWPIGAFVDAYRRVYPENQERISEMLGGLKQHLSEAGVGQISEIFDGNAPHLPRGCFAQAWSVAELLRVQTVS
jgi:predicted glycogen debranching enzyme